MKTIEVRDKKAEYQEFFENWCHSCKCDICRNENQKEKNKTCVNLACGG